MEKLYFYNSMYIDAKDRTVSTDNPNNFKNPLTNIFNIKGFAVKKIALTYNVYNVQSANGNFYIDYNSGGSTLISLTPGNYNATTLATELQTKLQVVNASFAVSYNSTTGKYTITATNPFQFLLSGYPRPAALLGLPASNQIAATSLISSYPINILFTHYFDICSDLLLEYGYASHSSSNQTQKILKRVYVNDVADFSNINIIYYEPRIIPYHSNKQIPIVDIRIYDEYGIALDLNNQNINIQLDLYR